MHISKNQFRAGDVVIITDIHSDDPHYPKKDLLLNKKAFIFKPQSKEWIRNKHMKEWLSCILTIEGEVYWFWGVKVDPVETTEEESETIN